MAGHVVTAGCVVARTRDGGEAYFYAGATLPETVSAAEKERLVEVGLVSPVEGGATAEVAEVDEPPRAGKGSGRAEWAAYAASLGIVVDSAATRDDIIAAVDGV